MDTYSESLLPLVGDFDERVDAAVYDRLLDGLVAPVAVNAVQEQLDELVAHGHDHVLTPAVERHLTDVHDVLIEVAQATARHPAATRLQRVPPSAHLGRAIFAAHTAAADRSERNVGVITHVLLHVLSIQVALWR